MLLYDIWISEVFKYNVKAIYALLIKLGTSKDVYNESNKEIENILHSFFGKRIKLTEKEKLGKRDLTDAEKILKDCEKKNILIYCFFNEEYPDSLRYIYDPPYLLYFKGSLCKGYTEKEFAAIVGARKASAYGKWAAHGAAKILAENNVVIVSGMAYGIDAYAHQGALDGNGNTIAVLGSGVDICYPQSNYSLMKRIMESGALISEFSPGTPAVSAHFPMRNRIISGLCQNVIIAEAKKKSGSLITTDYALEQGKDIFAFPGNINSLYSEGTNKLIRDGATPIINLNEIPILLNIANLKKKAQKKITEKLGEDENRVVNAIKKQNLNTVDSIAKGVGFSCGEVMSILTILEIKKVIYVDSGKISVAF